MDWLVGQDHAALVSVYERSQAAQMLSSDELMARHGIRAEDITAEQAAPGGLTVVDGVAVIEVKGLLLEKASPLMSLLGVANTGYSDIRAAIAAAQSDDNVESVQLRVDSPGGQVRGLTKTADAIAASEKGVEAICENVCASAAYWIASQADTIEATSRADVFGSVGVAFVATVDPAEVTITSSGAPDKIPDLTTAEGVAVVRRQLDEKEAIFFEAVAAGRRTTVEKVAADFGRGAVMTAALAMGAGMIDKISDTTQTQDKDQMTTANSTSGVRAALGLSKDASHELIIETALAMKAGAERVPALEADLASSAELLTVHKEQLATATARIEETAAAAAAREKELFIEKRDASIEAAIKDGKITPAQVPSITAIAKDPAGLEQVEDMFKASANLGLTKVTPGLTDPPKGTTATSYLDGYETAEDFSKAAGVPIAFAKKKFEEKNQ